MALSWPSQTMPRNSLAIGMGPSHLRKTTWSPRSSKREASRAYSRSSRTRSELCRSSTAPAPVEMLNWACTSSAMSLARSGRGRWKGSRFRKDSAARARICGASFGERVESLTNASDQPLSARAASICCASLPPSNMRPGSAPEEACDSRGACASATQDSRDSGRETLGNDHSATRGNHFSRPAAKNSSRIRCCSSSLRSSAGAAHAESLFAEAPS
mmetsp:Transcript_12886/g.35379  ORF Transcript_12886/g.35379 Transcript_12886/m.35379 type:complete len:216 (-) Transcript_12886:117-764(-)